MARWVACKQTQPLPPPISTKKKSMHTRVDRRMVRKKEKRKTSKNKKENNKRRSRCFRMKVKIVEDELWNEKTEKEDDFRDNQTSEIAMDDSPTQVLHLYDKNEQKRRRSQIKKPPRHVYDSQPGVL